MEVHFTPELEARLSHFAAQQGRNPDQLIQDALTRYLAEEADDRKAVMSHIEEGFLQAERGELLDGDEVTRQITDLKEGWRRERSLAR